MEMRNGATRSPIFLFLWNSFERFWSRKITIFPPESFLDSFIDLRIYYLIAHSSYMYNLLNNIKVIKADIDCHYNIQKSLLFLLQFALGKYLLLYMHFLHQVA